MVTRDKRLPLALLRLFALLEVSKVEVFYYLSSNFSLKSHWTPWLRLVCISSWNFLNQQFESSPKQARLCIELDVDLRDGEEHVDWHAFIVTEPRRRDLAALINLSMRSTNIRLFNKQ